MLAGADDWNLRGVPRLGLEGIKVSDCGHGVTQVGEDESAATCFPTGIGMASTWNSALLEDAGRVIGREARALGCSLLLGPKINIHRIPLNGRSFETFSEDPWLAGLLGAAVIRGIQRAGVGACVKAMTANNQQKDQDVISSAVDERTLREIYLKPFELALRHGNPCAVMTAYNRLNGEYTSESRWLIQTVVKDEWDFRGFVVSDWRAVRTERVYQSGLDLEMPGPGTFLKQAAVQRALDEGLLTESEIDDKVLRLLKVLVEFGPSGAPAGALDTPAHRKTALRVAEESIVLLKNDNVLPMEVGRLRRILVTGPNATAARLGGGGSASVTPFYAVSPLQGIREICGSDVEVEFIEGGSLTGLMEATAGCFRHQSSGRWESGLKTEFFNTEHLGSEPVVTTVTERLDYSWGWAAPEASVRRGNFSVRFSGEIVPPKSGRYRLAIFAQEGCVRLRVGDRNILQEWEQEESNFEASFKTTYETFEVDWIEGEGVAILLEYGKRKPRAAVRLEWEIPGSRSPILEAAEAASRADAVIVCAGLSNLLEGGGHDRSGMDIPQIQQDLIHAVSRKNPRTIVVLFNGGPVLVPWADQVAGLIEAWYPGQEGGRALARILFGHISPSGRLPDTIPRRLEDHASAANYPGDGDEVRYEEGVRVGYRHFDSCKIEPHFPFGFGLSYTSFEISAPVIPPGQTDVSQGITVLVSVRNTGARAGSEVVQIYIRRLGNEGTTVDKELRAFRKENLAPGESREIRFVLKAEHFEVFNEASSSWILPAARYEILAGPHSRSLQGAVLDLTGS